MWPVCEQVNNCIDFLDTERTKIHRCEKFAELILKKKRKKSEQKLAALPCTIVLYRKRVGSTHTRTETALY